MLPRSRWWTFYSWAWVITWLVIATVLCVIIGGPAALLGDRQRRVAHRMLVLGHRGIAFTLRFAVSVSGLENLPRQPCILCPNHQSLSDVVYLYQLPWHFDFKWLVKKEFFKLPLFGTSMTIARYPSIDRGDPDSALAIMAEVHEYLTTGVSILSFPEGTRTTTGDVGSFQSGTARMAIAEQVDLVPIGIAGSRNVLPKGSGMFAPRGHVAIHVGEAIPTAGLERKDARKLTRRIREAVVAAKGIALERCLRRLPPTRSPGLRTPG